ncbi:unnamed protein product [Gadus morhua 'NCC']
MAFPTTDLTISPNRKFSNIEAANQRLASALLCTKEENTSPSFPGQKPVTPEPSVKPTTGDGLAEKANDPMTNTSKDIEQASKLGSGSAYGSIEMEISKQRQPESRHFLVSLPKSQASTGTWRGKSQGHRAPNPALQNMIGNENQAKSTSFLNSPEHTEFNHQPGVSQTACDRYEKTTQRNRIHRSEVNVGTARLKETDNNNNNQDRHFKSASDSDVIIHLDEDLDLSLSPSFSPDLSPLSLDSCDFSVQSMLDMSTCFQKNHKEDTVENQWTDMMEVLQTEVICRDDLEDCMNMEEFFENVCICQEGSSELEGDVCCDDITTSSMNHERGTCMGHEIFQIQSNDNCGSEAEHLKCIEGKYGYGGSDAFQSDLGLPFKNLTSDQRTSQNLPASRSEIVFNETASDQDKDNQSNSIFSIYLCNNSTLNTYSCAQQESSCAFEACNNKTGTHFEGVAQSFSAHTETQYHPILTPPFENDWLFTEIV